MQEYDGLLVETITNGPFVENCFLVADAATKHAILIDPGDEEERIAAVVERAGVQVVEIVNTHGHIDHAGAVAALKKMLGVPFAIHPGERAWLEHLAASAVAFGLPSRPTPEVDRDLAHGQPLQVGDVTGKVLHTPGHTEGGCCLYFPDQRIVFVGDTLFAGSVGRTDLPGGSTSALIRSIREQLLSLEDDVVVFSGHGPETDIGTERRTNPFLRPGARL
jgi:glyoxylase-like metal-dependent hydrolase (beta-lactamase superfamily II)